MHIFCTILMARIPFLRAIRSSAFRLHSAAPCGRSGKAPKTKSQTSVNFSPKSGFLYPLTANCSLQPTRGQVLLLTKALAPEEGNNIVRFVPQATKFL